MNRFSFPRPCRLCAAALLLTLAAGCGGLRPSATPQPSFYSLDSVWTGNEPMAA